MTRETSGQGNDRQVIDRTWQRHIRNIPENDYYLCPSCILAVGNPATEAMVPRVFDLLGLRWGTNSGPESMCTCCSGIGYHADVVTIESTLLIVARLWSLAQESGCGNIAVTCVTSFGIHHECRELYLNEPGLKARIDRLLLNACGRRFEIPEHIVHVSDIIHHHRQTLRDKFMKYQLDDILEGRPLRVVDHIGCHYNKLFPDQSLGGSTHCEVLSGLTQAWQGMPLDYPERLHCCGMGFRQCMLTPNRSYTAACVNKKIQSMKPFQPDLILTNCPGCQVYLDREQWAINEITGNDYFVPVLTYMQLAGLLMGWDPYAVVGVQYHVSSVEPLLDKIGIPYDESQKWRGKDGQVLEYAEELIELTLASGQARRGEIIL